MLCLQMLMKGSCGAFCQGMTTLSQAEVPALALISSKSRAAFYLSWLLQEQASRPPSSVPLVILMVPSRDRQRISKFGNLFLRFRNTFPQLRR